MRHKSIREQHQNWCIHFTGIYQQVCKAGIAYIDVRDSSKSPYAWPCIHDSNAATTCALVQYPTDEEAIEHEREVSAHIAEMVRKLEGDICPHCDTPVERQRQVGRCVYAEPCGHRLFQGKARQVKS